MVVNRAVRKQKIAHLPYFIADRRGRGVGGILSGLLRSFTPVIKSALPKAGKYLAREGLQLGSDIIKDIVKKRPVKQSIKRRAQATSKRIAKKTLKELQGNTGIKKRRVRKIKSKPYF